MADINKLIVFARVAEAGSLSGAARRTGMPVSTVSRKIAELEDQLGVRLIERSTRQLRLTDVGQEVLEQAQHGLEIGEAVESIVANRNSEVRGTLRLSAPPSLSDSLLAPLIRAFQASYPGVSVHVFVTSRMVDHISEGVDIALRFGHLRDSALVSRPLLRYRHVLLASPEYLDGRRLDDPDQLSDHRLLAFMFEPQLYRWILHRGSEKRTIEFQPSLAMNDYAGIAALLTAGSGIGELPALVAHGLVAQRRLVEVLPDWRFEPLEFSVVHLGNRHIARPVRLFKEFAIQAVPNLFRDLPV